MDTLPKAEADSIKKMSTARLVSKLTKVGYSVDDIEKMSRETMVDTWAHCVVDGKDKEDTLEAAGGATGPEHFEREKLNFEKQKFEAEHSMRLRETALKEAELKMLEQKHAAERAEKNSVVLLAKRYGEAIRASVMPMGPDVLDVVSFFKHVEVIFDHYKVPTNLKALLLQPYLNEKSRSVVARMDPAKCNDYDAVRDVILKEHKLSPCAYLDLFNTLSQSVSETTVMYSARLKSLLKMYVESRKVTDFETLMSLIVCDRIKSTLKDGCLRYVLSVEASTTQGWLGSHELAECIDLYKANHLASGKPHAGAIGNGMRPNNVSGPPNTNNSSPTQKQPYTPKSSPASNPTGQFSPSSSGNAQSNSGKGPTGNIVCYKCRQIGHTRKHCPLITKASDHHVNVCSLHTPYNAHMGTDTDNTCSGSVTNTVLFKQVSDNSVDERTCIDWSADQGLVAGNTAEIADETPRGNSVENHESSLDFVSLQYIDVTIEELNSDDEVLPIRAVADSGSELCVVKSCFVESIVLPKIGTVRLRGIVGAPVEADLVKLHISLVDGDSGYGLGGGSSSIPVVCAVCSDLNEDMILTTALVKQLQSVSVQGDSAVNSLQCKSAVGFDSDVQSGSDVDIGASSPEQQATSDIPEVDDLDQTGVSNSVCDSDLASDGGKVTADVFRAEQKTDESLQRCWVMADRGKGGFIVQDGLLYHQEKLDSIGEQCTQLCLPASHRKTVLELAHCTLGCHQAYRRTRDRIRVIFLANHFG